MTRSGLFTPVANPATSKAPLVADVSPVPTTPLDDIQELSEGASFTYQFANAGCRDVV